MTSLDLVFVVEVGVATFFAGFSRTEAFAQIPKLQKAYPGHCVRITAWSGDRPLQRWELRAEMEYGGMLWHSSAVRRAVAEDGWVWKDNGWILVETESARGPYEEMLERAEALMAAAEEWRRRNEECREVEARVESENAKDAVLGIGTPHLDGG